MKINKLIKNSFKLKNIVGFSLIVALVGMSTILGIGYAQIRNSNSDKEQTDLSAELPGVERTIETTVQIVGGENGTPTITLKTTPEIIAPGESATIDWEAKDADVCAASGAWSGVKNSVGNQNTGALQETQSYSLTCTNSKGFTTVDTKVTVDASLTPTVDNNSTSNTSTPASSGGTTNPPDTGGGSSDIAPVLTMSISSGSINAGSTATISWSINGTASPNPSCSASGSWSGSKATSGSENVSPGVGSYSYSLNCSNSAGSSSKSVSLTVTAVSSCGSGGSCTLSEVSTHNTQSNCWVVIKYTASGGNGTNGQVYQLSSGLFGSGGSHNGLPSAPSLSASSWCGKNISSTFNDKHSNGSRSDGSHTAIWWLTNNGNSLIGPYSGS